MNFSRKAVNEFSLCWDCVNVSGARSVSHQMASVLTERHPTQIGEHSCSTTDHPEAYRNVFQFLRFIHGSGLNFPAVARGSMSFLLWNMYSVPINDTIPDECTVNLYSLRIDESYTFKW